MDVNKFAGVEFQLDMYHEKESLENYVVACIDVIWPKKNVLNRRELIKVFQVFISSDFSDYFFTQLRKAGDLPPRQTLIKRTLYPVRGLARWLIEKGYCEPTRTN